MVLPMRYPRHGVDKRHGLVKVPEFEAPGDSAITRFPVGNGEKKKRDFFLSQRRSPPFARSAAPRREIAEIVSHVTLVFFPLAATCDGDASQDRVVCGYLYHFTGRSGFGNPTLRPAKRGYSLARIDSAQECYKFFSIFFLILYLAATRIR